jgi:hypothetical protein
VLCVLVVVTLATTGAAGAQTTRSAAGAQAAAMRVLLRPVAPLVVRCANDLEFTRSVTVRFASQPNSTARLKAAVARALQDCRQAARGMERFGGTTKTIRAALPAVLRGNATAIDLLFQMRCLADNAVQMSNLVQRYFGNTAVDVGTVYIYTAIIQGAATRAHDDVRTLCKEWGIPTGSRTSLLTLLAPP